MAKSRWEIHAASSGLTAVLWTCGPGHPGLSGLFEGLQHVDARGFQSVLILLLHCCQREGAGLSQTVPCITFRDVQAPELVMGCDWGLGEARCPFRCFLSPLLALRQPWPVSPHWASACTASSAPRLLFPVCQPPFPGGTGWQAAQHGHCGASHPPCAAR